MTPEQAPHKIFLLDAMALIYRAHFAFSKNPRINTKGMNTGAILGFTNTLVEVIQKEKPTHIVVAFDKPGPTFRHQTFSDYKANRDAQPEDITLAIPYIKSVISAFQIPIIEQEGYEADDIIGTIAHQIAPHEGTVYMMTPDKDFAQLVSDHIYLYKPAFMGNGVTIMGKKEVLEKWGIQHIHQVRDLLGLQGDAVDNIPGIPKVGPKTAQKLISQFGSVENLIANADQLTGKLRETVIQHAQQGILSKALATIDTQVPLSFTLEQSRYKGPDEQQLTTLFEELEFKTLARRILSRPTTAPASTGAEQTTLFGNTDTPTAPSPISLATLATTEHHYHLVDTPQKRNALINTLLQQSVICFDTETTGTNSHEAQLLGISFAYKPREAHYIPIPQDPQLARQIVQELKPILGNNAIQKVGQNLKYDINMLQRYGITVSLPLFDTMIAHALLAPDSRHNLDSMAANYLNYAPLSIETLIGPKGKQQKNMAEVEQELLKEYACEDADITLQLYQKMKASVSDHHLEQLLYDIEFPLISVLSAMESAGVKIDTDALAALSRDMEHSSQVLSQEIQQLAGEPFNIASPKQMGHILFEKLKLVEKPKKTKTGQYATNEEVLQTLVKNHPIVSKILEYRALQKLKSTYVDALPMLLSPADHMIHTSYNQAIASTGRLSSTNPNLQNIPIRTEQGRAIRKAFIPRSHQRQIISADYSQIELRIMASFAQDPNMIAAFQAGKDIHQATASKLFNVSLDCVTKDMRRQAKTANFGIIYGISAFGLSQRLQIKRSEADALIRAYFKEFSAIKTYMDQIVAQAREQGYVTTLLGRKRWLPDINSRNAAQRGFAERNAINAPIQGTAAEMIKKAMIQIHHWLQSEQMDTHMMLQVHDELVFDAPQSEVSQLLQQVPIIMQTAMTLDVPLEVDIRAGDNWLDAH